MNRMHLDELELGRRVVQYLVVDNDLAPVSRMAAIAYRAMVDQ